MQTLEPKKSEMFVAFTGMDLATLKTYLEEVISSWNGRDEQFIHEGDLFNEDHVYCAEGIIEMIDELQEALNEWR